MYGEQARLLAVFGMTGVPEHEEWGVVCSTSVEQWSASRPRYVHTFHKLPRPFTANQRHLQSVQEAGKRSFEPRRLRTRTELPSVC